MQAITGHWPTFIREIQSEILGEDGFEGYLDWGHARGRDFQCLASIAYLASKYPVHSHPAAQQLERWLQDLDPIPETLHARLSVTFRVFVTLVRDKTLRAPFQQPTRVSPVEFVMIGLLIFVHARTLSMTQLSSAIERLRADVRSSFIDIRMNTRTLKHMFSFIKGKVNAAELKSDKNGDVPAVASHTQIKAAKSAKPAQSAKPVKKRKRVVESDDEDDEDEPPAPKTTKSKSTAEKSKSPSDTQNIPKRQKQSKPKLVPGSAVPQKGATRDNLSNKQQPLPSPSQAPKPATVTSTKVPALIKPAVPTPIRRFSKISTPSASTAPTSAPVLGPSTPSFIIPTRKPMPSKVEGAGSSSTLLLQPPPPPSRRLSKPLSRPPSVSSMPSSSMAPPAVPSPAVPQPSASPSSVPAPVSSAPVPRPEPPQPATPQLPQPPPPVTIKRESQPSPPIPTFAPTTVSSRLAPLRAARAAVSNTKIETQSSIPGLRFGPPSSSNILHGGAFGSTFASQDPRHPMALPAPAHPQSHLPSPANTQPPLTDLQSNIEELLMRAGLQNRLPGATAPTSGSNSATWQPGTDPPPAPYLNGYAAGTSSAASGRLPSSDHRINNMSATNPAAGAPEVRHPPMPVNQSVNPNRPQIPPGPSAGLPHRPLSLDDVFPDRVLRPPPINVAVSDPRSWPGKSPTIPTPSSATPADPRMQTADRSRHGETLQERDPRYSHPGGYRARSNSGKGEYWDRDRARRREQEESDWERDRGRGRDRYKEWDVESGRSYVRSSTGERHGRGR
jgi:hypothetical protein